MGPTDTLLATERGYTLVREENDDGGSTLLVPTDDASTVQAEAAALASLEGVDGVAKVIETRADGALVIEPPALGTLEDLPVLEWRLPQRLAVFRRICDVVSRLHGEGRPFGTLVPARILIDETLAPFLLGASGEIGGYGDPRLVGEPTLQSDVYNLGRILYFVLDQKEPDQETSSLPRLKSLDRFPAGLSRIVRRCTVNDLTRRYTSAGEVLNDIKRYGKFESVGLSHPDAPEENVSGISLRPLPMAAKAPEERESREQVKPNTKSDWTVPPRARWAVVALGAALAIVGLGLAWIGMGGVATSGLVALGFALLTFAVPLPSERHAMARASLFAFVLCVGMVSSPGDLLVPLGASMRLSGDLESRQAAVATLTKNGEKEFSGLDLEGARLDGLDFSEANLTGTNLARASLRATDLTGARIDGVDVAGADLAQADLHNLDLSTLRGIDTARCNDDTVLPDDFVCQNGSIINSPSEVAQTE